MTSEITVSDFANICRICLVQGTNMVPITSLNVIDMIVACSTVQVWQNDELPKQICKGCLRKLKNAYSLKKLCERSNRKLNRIVENEHKSNAEVQESLLAKIKVEIEPDMGSGGASTTSDACADDDIKFEEQWPTGTAEIPLEKSAVNCTSDETTTSFPEKPAVVQADGKYTCELCEQVFGIVWRLGLHMRKKHRAEPLHCAKCSQLYYHPLHLEDHISNHDESRLTCSSCNKKFINIQKLKKHQVVHKDRMYHCLKCDKSFKGRFILNKHEKMFHNGPQPRQDCTICGKSVIQANMHIHLKIHDRRTLFACEECPKKFVRVDTLREHVRRIHRNEAIRWKQLCNVCGLGVLGNSELRRHMLSHTGEKPYQCNMCDKRFQKSHAVKRHIRSAHTDERPFGCTVCGKAFHTKVILQGHMRTHTRERPFSCLACPKAFGTKSLLKTHMKVHL